MPPFQMLIKNAGDSDQPAINQRYNDALLGLHSLATTVHRIQENSLHTSLPVYYKGYQ